MYYMYELTFNSFLHIGNKKLDDVNISMDSDTFFSAIINEIAENFDDEYIELFVEKAKEDKFLISNLFPYSGRKYYLPKPLAVNENSKDIEQFTKKDEEKIQYIEFANIPRYYGYLKGEYELKEEDIKSFKNSNFGEKVIFTKNNLQQEEPELFSVGAFKFNYKSGLYFYCYIEEDLKEIFDKVMKSLSYTGIGGKKSTGYGNFNFKVIEIPKKYPIYKRLSGEKGDVNMLISFTIPTERDLIILKDNATYYEITKKTGFNYSKSSKKPMYKKKPVVGLKSGSVMSEKMKGDIIDISNKKDNHAIYKYGKAMYYKI